MEEKKISTVRLDILEKIKQCEKDGFWDIDPENDPPTIPLEPNKIDYLSRNPFKKIMCHIVNRKANKFT